MSERSVALRRWIAAQPTNGTPAGTFQGQRCGTARIPALRYEPPPAGPALLASVTAPDGRLTAVYHLPLTSDGEQRGAGVTIGPPGVGAVVVTPLPADFTFLGITATIEEALAVAGRWSDFPVWSSLSAARLGHIWVPRSIQAIVIFAGTIEASARAAEEAEQFYRARGKLTHVEYLRVASVA